LRAACSFWSFAPSLEISPFERISSETASKQSLKKVLTDRPLEIFDAKRQAIQTSTMTAAAMTKDELKAALGSIGIDSSGKAKKDELVALYEEHVAADVAEDGLPRGDFSCDGGGEIALANLKKNSNSSKKGSGRKSSKINSDSITASPATKENGIDLDASALTAAPSADNTMVVGDIDVSKLTDDQLSEALIERGIEVGPIVETTRKLYRRKLAGALRNESMNGSQNGVAAATVEKEEKNGVVLQDAEFSADDEEIINGDGGADTAESNGEHVTNGDSQVNGDSTDSDDLQPSMVIKKTTPSPQPVLPKTSPMASLRQRFLGNSDAPDSSKNATERFTPTPRRSIHTYKVTEKSTESMVKNKDGTVNYDFDYTKETSESKSAAANNKLATLLRILPGFFLFLLGLVLAYYVYTKRK